jgi:hypothetical protein
VWLFHSHACLDHGVPERIAARAFMDLVIRTFAGTDRLEVHDSPQLTAVLKPTPNRLEVEF